MSDSHVTFDSIEAEFLARVGRMVWCNLATVDRANRPRSRIMHPIWVGAVGWLTTRRQSFKAKHLARLPYVSLAYIADLAKPVYVDCRAEWVDDSPAKNWFWDVCPTLPPPQGFDLGAIYSGRDDPEYGLLKLTPWRLELVDGARQSRVWRPEHSGGGS